MILCQSVIETYFWKTIPCVLLQGDTSKIEIVAHYDINRFSVTACGHDILTSLKKLVSLCPQKMAMRRSKEKRSGFVRCYIVVIRSNRGAKHVVVGGLVDWQLCHRFKEGVVASV